MGAARVRYFGNKYMQRDRQCTNNITMALSSNRCYNRKATIRFVYCWATLPCQQYKNTLCSTTILLWRIYVAGNNNTCIVFHVWCSIFFPDFNQIWSFSVHFNSSPQYQVSPKSVQWQPRRYIWTYGNDEANRYFSRLSECD